MTKKKRLALLAAVVGATAATTAQAATYNGDLIIGFTAQVGSDLMYDLGTPTSITNGQTWNLNSLLTSFELDTVKWGVVGSDANNEIAYVTKATGTPGTLTETHWGNADTAVTAIYSIFPTAGAGHSVAPSSTLANSWDQQTIDGSLTTTYHNAYLNPNTTGLTAINFFRTAAGGTPATKLGTFTLAANGVVTFNTVSTVVTPPPPRIVSILRAGNNSTVFFTTTNGSFSYKLYFTNASGLASPVSNWTASATSITGNGLTNSILDTSADTNRFYRVGVH